MLERPCQWIRAGLPLRSSSRVSIGASCFSTSHAFFPPERSICSAVMTRPPVLGPVCVLLEVAWEQPRTLVRDAATRTADRRKRIMGTPWETPSASGLLAKYSAARSRPVKGECYPHDAQATSAVGGAGEERARKAVPSPLRLWA